MQTVDGYTLIRELGRGGAGVVYEARHPNATWPLALKILHETDPETILRFEREAHLLGSVSHPNVMKIHSVGRSKAGPYLVTELLEGEELWALARRVALAPSQAAKIVQELACAVHAVHQAGVVHRDLKPHNVHVRPDGTPVLLDFGIARRAGAQRLTQTGALVGTPAFMAPEQAAHGSSEALDVRTDVYGLGAILFSLLARRPPFDGASALTVLTRVIEGEPRWPSEDDPRVPPALEAVCRRAMSKAPDDRYPSADAMAQALERVLEAERPRGRRAALPWLGAALGLTALLALVVTLGLRQEPAPPPEAAQRPTAPARAALPNVAEPARVRRPLRRVGTLKPAPGPEAVRLAATNRLMLTTAALPRGRALSLGYGALTLWSLETRRQTSRLEDRNFRPYRGLAVSPDGETIAIGDGPTIYLVHVGHELELTRSLDSGRPRRILAFSPSGALLALGGPTSVALVAWPSLEPVFDAPFPEPNVMAFSPDSQTLAAASAPNAGEYGASRFACWSTDSGAVLAERNVDTPVTSLAVSPDSASLVLGTFTGELRRVEQVRVAAPELIPRWGPNLKESKGVFVPTTARVVGLAFDPSASWLYVLCDGFQNSVLRTVSYPEGQVLDTVTPQSSGRRLALSDTGILVVSSEQGWLELFSDR